MSVLPSNLFRDMSIAPKDGLTGIEVRHGRNQEIVRAEYAGQLQGFIRSDDPLRRVLHMVTGWRPITGHRRHQRNGGPRELPAYIFKCYVFLLSFVMFPVVVDSLW